MSRSSPRTRRRSSPARRGPSMAVCAYESSPLDARCACLAAPRAAPARARARRVLLWGASYCDVTSSCVLEVASLRPANSCPAALLYGTTKFVCMCVVNRHCTVRRVCRGWEGRGGEGGGGGHDVEAVSTRRSSRASVRSRRASSSARGCCGPPWRSSRRTTRSSRGSALRSPRCGRLHRGPPGGGCDTTRCDVMWRRG